MAIQDLISVTPNSFQLRGYNIGVSYLTTSATGESQLAYTHRGETLNFRGDQIRLDRTPFGQRIVTVDLEEEMFTLLIPTMKLSATTRKSPLEMIARLSSHPAHKTEGQLQTYMPMCLSGTADHPVF